MNFRIVHLTHLYGPRVTVEAGKFIDLQWQIPDSAGQPIAQVGFEITAPMKTTGSIYLDYLTWVGAPSLTFSKPVQGGQLWKKAWVDSLQQAMLSRFPFHLVQNEGKGLLTQGTSDWRDYSVSAIICPTILRTGGIVLRAQGVNRYYALVLCEDKKIRLIKSLEVKEKILGEMGFSWKPWKNVKLKLEVSGTRLRGYINRRLCFDVADDYSPLLSGAAGFLVDQGQIITPGMTITPISY